MSFRILIVLILGISLTLVLGSGCLSSPLPGGETTREFQGTYNISRAKSLEVHNLNGAVEIATRGQETAQVNATLHSLYGSSELDQVQISVATDDIFRIETVHLAFQPRVTVNYFIDIPRWLPLSIIESSNGEIAVKNAIGNAQLATSNGPISVENFSGNLTAHTNNGQVWIENIEGMVSVFTSNAEIAIRNARSILRAETSNGRIDADIIYVDHDVSLTTSNALVLIQLAPDVNANLVLSTSNGQILLTNVSVAIQQATRTDLRGMIGRGGNTVTVITSNADIHVSPLSL